MGTSTSSKGPGANSPLIPPWADSNPDSPPPPPQEGPRFQSFKLNLGKFVKSGDKSYLHRSLGNYSKTATGGNKIGPRRFGAVSKAGALLFGAIRDLREGGTAVEYAKIDLSFLDGKPLPFAIQELSRALTPLNGDADKIRSAINIALSEALDGHETFDPSSVTDDVLVDIIIFYLRECVFEQVVMDSDKAFQKGDLNKCHSAEQALHDLVNIVVDQKLRPYMSDDIVKLDTSQVMDIQLKAVTEVWKEWEAYDHD